MCLSRLKTFLVILSQPNSFSSLKAKEERRKGLLVTPGAHSSSSEGDASCNCRRNLSKGCVGSFRGSFLTCLVFRPPARWGGREMRGDLIDTCHRIAAKRRTKSAIFLVGIRSVRMGRPDKRRVVGLGTPAPVHLNCIAGICFNKHWSVHRDFTLLIKINNVFFQTWRRRSRFTVSPIPGWLSPSWTEGPKTETYDAFMFKSK